MMILIIILCVVAVFVFFRTYKKEMKEKALRNEKKLQTKDGPASKAGDQTSGARKSA